MYPLRKHRTFLLWLCIADLASTGIDIHDLSGTCLLFQVAFDRISVSNQNVSAAEKFCGAFNRESHQENVCNCTNPGQPNGSVLVPDSDPSSRYVGRSGTSPCRLNTAGVIRHCVGTVLTPPGYARWPARGECLWFGSTASDCSHRCVASANTSTPCDVYAMHMQISRLSAIYLLQSRPGILCAASARW